MFCTRQNRQSSCAAASCFFFLSITPMEGMVLNSLKRKRSHVKRANAYHYHNCGRGCGFVRTVTYRSRWQLVMRLTTMNQILSILPTTNFRVGLLGSTQLPTPRSQRLPSVKKKKRVSWCFKPSQPQRITSGLKKKEEEKNPACSS